MMKEQTIEIKKTARYYTLGTLSENTKTVWFVCHGYGQLANYFLRNFKSLENEKTFVISPEGFHRYYLDGFSGRVGASWMTKEGRLNDIADYVAYLDQLYHNVFNLVNRNNVTVNVLGFSQGGATATRWTCQGISKIDNLILWAAVYPPDLNFEADTQTLNSLNFKLVIGDDDKFISESALLEHINLLDKKRINYELIRYNGTHNIDSDTLEGLNQAL
jgi:predicted esterase